MTTITSITTFNGGDVVSINTSLGWNTSPSTLNLRVVNDPEEGNILTVPKVGTYSDFSLGALTFGGLVTSVSTNQSTSGKSQFDINFKDAKKIMNDTLLIVSPTATGFGDLFANAGVLNVLDIFELSNDKFGGFTFNKSGWNQTGMPSDTIQNEVNKTTSTLFGQQYQFILNLPNIGPEIRIDATTISLAGFVQEMAELGGFDWYVKSTLVDSIVQVNIFTVDRTQNLDSLSLQTFLDRFPDRVVSVSSGVELRNDLAAVALQGAEQEFMFERDDIQDSQNKGVGINLGRIDPKFENLFIDLSAVLGGNNPWPQFYLPDTTEMRHALVSFEDWNFYITRPDLVSDRGLRKKPWQSEPELRSTYLPGNLTDILLGVTGKSVNSKKRIVLKSVVQKNEAGQPDDIGLVQDTTLGPPLNEAFSLIRQYSEDHYGKSFYYDDHKFTEIDSAWTLDGPFVGTGDKEPNRIFEAEIGKTVAYAKFDFLGTSDSVGDGRGFNPKTIDLSEINFEDYFWSGIPSNFGIPSDIITVEDLDEVSEETRVITEDNQAEADAIKTSTTQENKEAGATDEEAKEAGETASADFLAEKVAEGSINKKIDDRRANIAAESAKAKAKNFLLYIKCTAKDSLIKLPGRVKEFKEQADISSEVADVVGVILDSLCGQASETARNKAKDEDKDQAAQDTDAIAAEKKCAEDFDATGNDPKNRSMRKQLEEDIRNGEKEIGQQISLLAYPEIFNPTAVFIPVKSESSRWGPFISDVLGQGKVEIRTEDNYNPASFGSFNAMSAAATEKVKNAGTIVTEVENATVEIEGFPEVDTGDAIGINSNITNMTVSFSTGGIKTSYQLNTFEDKFAQPIKTDFDNRDKLNRDKEKRKPDALFTRDQKKTIIKGTGTKPKETESKTNVLDNGISGTRQPKTNDDGSVNEEEQEQNVNRGQNVPGSLDEDTQNG